jgi:HAD superfamily hydrolase (TIGR01509 family)
MIKAIIFDCFGVVVADTTDATYKLLGGDTEEDKEFLRDIYHKSSSGVIPAASPFIAEKLGVPIEVWEQELKKGRTINEDLLEYIKTLKENYKVGMLSNVSSLGLQRFITHERLAEYFEAVTESHVIGFAKPEARAYEIAAESLGVRLDECVFTDDREEYIEGAQHVGMKTIFFTGTEQFKTELEEMLLLDKS